MDIKTSSSNSGGVAVSPAKQAAAAAASAQESASPLQQDRLQLSAKDRERSIDLPSARYNWMADSSRLADIGMNTGFVGLGIGIAGIASFFGTISGLPALAAALTPLVFPLLVAGSVIAAFGLAVTVANTQW
jgi:hypothetical protein